MNWDTMYWKNRKGRSSKYEDYIEYLQMLISEFGPNADINPKSLGGIKKYVVQLADSIGENNKIFLNTVRRASTIADIEDAFKKFLFI